MASSEVRLSKAEIKRLHQEACKEVPCSSAGKLCPFCPWQNKKYTPVEDKP